MTEERQRHPPSHRHTHLADQREVEDTDLVVGNPGTQFPVLPEKAENQFCATRHTTDDQSVSPVGAQCLEGRCSILAPAVFFVASTLSSM